MVDYRADISLNCRVPGDCSICSQGDARAVTQAARSQTKYVRLAAFLEANSCWGGDTTLSPGNLFMSAPTRYDYKRHMKDLFHCNISAANLPYDPPECKPACQNGGVCVDYQKCSCGSSWTGSTCGVPVCSSPCKNGGSCVAPNVCSCVDGWSGVSCTGFACNGANACQNGGSCAAPDSCTCSSSWSGPTCGAPVCSSSCQNGGSCTAPDTCACISGFSGARCEIAPSSDHTVVIVASVGGIVGVVALGAIIYHAKRHPQKPPTSEEQGRGQPLRVRFASSFVLSSDLTFA
jgi:hypothetical protein